MRILHCLAPAPQGGLERVVQMLATAQDEAGHEVAVVGAISAGALSHPFFDAFRDTRVVGVPLELPDRAWLRERRAVAEEIRSRAPNVVHTHGYRSDVIGGWATRRLGVGLVSTAHGFTRGGLKNRAYEALQVTAYRRGGEIIAVSAPLRAELARRGVPDERLHLVRNAWRPDVEPEDRAAARRELGLAADGIVLGWVGRVGHEKGPDVALEALAGLPGASLSFIGDGPLRPGLEARARDLGLADRVRWHGWIPRADRLLRAFDLVVLSSRTEGTPIIALEAMAAGVPLVATDVGGVGDLVEDGREALLVPPENPEALARAVQRGLSEPDASGRRAAAAQARLATEHAVGVWVERHDRVYERAAGGGTT